MEASLLLTESCMNNVNGQYKTPWDETTPPPWMRLDMASGNLMQKIPYQSIWIPKNATHCKTAFGSDNFSRLQSWVMEAIDVPVTLVGVANNFKSLANAANNTEQLQNNPTPLRKKRKIHFWGLPG